MRWDLLCRVIDNYGDIGVAWRLARDLASRGQTVRLWLDDPSALAWMSPGGAAGVEVLHWTAEMAMPEPGDVVVETFGCEPPPAFVAAMAAMASPPAWINLEYLSAEPYVERSHGLPSPLMSGPGRGLVRWFFYPGFTERTGGLLREPGLLDQQRDFGREAWLASHGLETAPGERLVSLFCYEHAPLAALLPLLAGQPTLLLLTPGPAQRLAAACPWPAQVRGHALPWLAQPDYDRLLWSCDLNFVRGEDSVVRAMWAGRPFVWQIYPQHDGVHAGKLDALLARMARFMGDAAPALAAMMRGWNGLQALPAALPAGETWQAGCTAWRDHLAAAPDLCTALMRFAASKRAAGC